MIRCLSVSFETSLSVPFLLAFEAAALCGALPVLGSFTSATSRFSTEPVEIVTACSITFWSFRMFPGQGYRHSASALREPLHCRDEKTGPREARRVASGRGSFQLEPDRMLAANPLP
jgi:hypothetical protein